MLREVKQLAQDQHSKAASVLKLLLEGRRSSQESRGCTHTQNLLPHTFERAQLCLRDARCSARTLEGAVTGEGNTEDTLLPSETPRLLLDNLG